MRTLRLMALDLSLTAPAIAWSHNADGVWAPGTRTVRSDATGHQRIEEIRYGIHKILPCQPRLAIIEGGFVGHNNNSLLLAELAGIVKQDLWQWGVPYVLVAPSTIKLYATANGGAEKRDVLHAIRHRYGHVVGGPDRFRDDNQTDAFTAMAMAFHHYGQPLAPVSAKQARALASVKWPTIALPPSAMPAPGGGGDNRTSVS